MMQLGLQLGSQRMTCAVSFSPYSYNKRGFVRDVISRTQDRCVEQGRRKNSCNGAKMFNDANAKQEKRGSLDPDAPDISDTNIVTLRATLYIPRVKKRIL